MHSATIKIIQQRVVTFAMMLYFTSYVVTEYVTWNRKNVMLRTELRSTHYMGSHHGLGGGGGRGGGGEEAPGSRGGGGEKEKFCIKLDFL